MKSAPSCLARSCRRGDAGHHRQEVALRRGRADEVQRVGVASGSGSRSSGVRTTLARSSPAARRSSVRRPRPGARTAGPRRARPPAARATAWSCPVSMPPISSTVCLVRTAWSTSASCSFTSASGFPHPEAGRTRACAYPRPGDPPRPDSRLSVVWMVVMEPAAPLTRSNRASGVGVIVKMALILSGSRDRARTGLVAPDREVRGDEPRSPGSTASRPAGTLSSITITVRSGPEPARRAGRGRSRRRSRRRRRRVRSRRPRTRGRRTRGRGSASSSIRSIASPLWVCRALASSVSIATPSRYRICHGWGRSASCHVARRRVRRWSRRRRGAAVRPRCTGARAPPGDPSRGSRVRGAGSPRRIGRRPAAHASRTRSGSTGTGPVVAVRSGSNPAARPTRSRISSGSSVCSPVIPNCLSGSPSWSSRMLRSTLSSGMADLGSGHGARKQALDQLLARDRARRPAVVEAGRRAACDPITSIDPIVRGAQR